ncbi:MAG: hypothetical protein K9H06_08005, partial [Melioribacteraceae bacterium]|nr:hypothetical protein [Melioribacteraceae bacterium]
VTRYLGPEGRGQYSIVANLIIIITLFLGEGIRRSNIIQIGSKSNSIRSVFNFNGIIFIGISVFGLIMFFLFPKMFIFLFKIDIEYVLIGVSAAFLGVFWKGVQAIFLGLQDYVRYNLILLNYTAGIFVLNFIIIYIIDLGLDAILFAFILVPISITIYEIVKILPLFENHNSDLLKSNNKKNLILKATITSIAGFFIIRGDIFIMNYFSNVSNTGIYSISKVFVDLFQKLPFLLGPIVIARSAATESSKEVANIAKLSRVLILVNFIAVVLIYLFGEKIIVVLFSLEFLAAYTYLLYLLPALIIFSSGHIINAFLLGQGIPTIVVINNVFIAFINLGLNFILIPLHGIEIIPIISAASFSLWTIIFIIYASQKYKIRISDFLLIKMDDINYILKFGK